MQSVRIRSSNSCGWTALAGFRIRDPQRGRCAACPPPQPQEGMTTSLSRRSGRSPGYRQSRKRALLVEVGLALEPRTCERIPIAPHRSNFCGTYSDPPRREQTDLSARWLSLRTITWTNLDVERIETF